MIRMCIKDRISSHSSYNLLFSEKIQLHFVLVLWRVIGHPYIESATALSDSTIIDILYSAPGLDFPRILRIGGRGEVARENNCLYDSNL